MNRQRLFSRISMTGIILALTQSAFADNGLLFARIRLHVASDAFYTLIGYAVVIAVCRLVYLLLQYAFRKYFIYVPKDVAKRRDARLIHGLKIGIVGLVVLACCAGAYVGANLKRWKKESDDHEYELLKSEREKLILTFEQVKAEQIKKQKQEEHYKDTILEEIPEPEGANKFFEKNWRDERNAEIRKHNEEALRRRRTKAAGN